MAGPVRIFTAALFVTHFMVGCCAHHACDGTAHSRSDHGAVATDGDCSGDHDSHSDHGKHGCQVSPCYFVLPSQPVNHSVGQPSRAFFAPLVDDQTSQSAISAGQRSMPPGGFSLTIHRHLANQVLLI
jgi:hypothetical protein